MVKDTYRQAEILSFMLQTWYLVLLEPQSRSGDKPVKFEVVLSPNGTAVLKGLRQAERTVLLQRERVLPSFVKIITTTTAVLPCKYVALCRT